LLAGGGLAGGAMATAGPALAAGPAPSCSAGICTVTFATPGAGQSFTVPAGVRSLLVRLWGGAGGGQPGGGDGALVTATLQVTPGSMLGVGVGGGASDLFGTAGANGGGSGGEEASGGGGATDVTLSGTPLLVAGGGGGSGSAGIISTTCPGFSFTHLNWGAAGNADAPGGNGTGVAANGLYAGPGLGGKQGTAAAGGTGGAGGLADGIDPPCTTAPPQRGIPGAPGKSLSGGFGGPAGPGGGGGGAGYYGGGGGGSGTELYYGASGYVVAGGGGGGGGSSYDAGTGVTAARISDTGNPPGQGLTTAANGKAVFSYVDPATGSPSLTR
jgi:hypothetical protein